jgi:hypothetical protein
MIERTYDDGYHLWFAWRPVLLKWEGGYGNPVKRDYRVIWLRFVHRKRTVNGTYYSVFEGGKPEYRF